MNGARDIRKVALLAGEPSGDMLGAELIKALRKRAAGPDLEVMGVGGDLMEAEGLRSLFDYSELSIVGLGAVLARLPQLAARIRQTARAVVEAEPDVLIIIDSPAFTHRVARQLRAKKPGIPIVNYVCPTVWAHKPKRAVEMLAYVDHVLSVYPFEPEIVAALGGPPVTYVGHPLVSDRQLLATRARQAERGPLSATQPATCLLLPGSRSGEVKRLMEPLGKAAGIIATRQPGTRFVVPAVARLAETIKAAAREWPVEADIRVGAEAKWEAFATADAAIAASGTVLLELALIGLPAVSIYKLDAIAYAIVSRQFTGWTAALPNMIADYPLIAEYFQERLLPGAVAREAERLLTDTPERAAMLAGCDAVFSAMETQQPPGERAAAVVVDVVSGKS